MTHCPSIVQYRIQFLIRAQRSELHISPPNTWLLSGISVTPSSFTVSVAACNKMSTPPKYDDLSKSASDLLSKGYVYGFTKLSVTTKTQSGIQFKSAGQSANDTGKVTGSFETKYEYKDYGLTFTESWKTDNVLGTNVTVEDQLIEGLKVGFDTTFSPSTGKKSAVIEAGYRRDYINVNADVQFDVGGPIIHGAAVLGYEGWLAGYQVGYDTGKSEWWLGAPYGGVRVQWKTACFWVCLRGIWLGKDICVGEMVMQEVAHVR